MPEESDHLCREVTIINKLGLHARSAAKIAAIARQTKYPVWLSNGEEEVDAKSIMDILILNRPKGSRLMIRVENDTAHDVLSDILQLVRDGFGELNENDRQ